MAKGNERNPESLIELLKEMREGLLRDEPLTQKELASVFRKKARRYANEHSITGGLISQ